MSTCGTNTAVYRPIFNINTSIIANIIIAISVVMGVQLIITIFLIVYGYANPKHQESVTKQQSNQNRMSRLENGVRIGDMNFQKQLEINHNQGMKEMDIHHEDQNANKHKPQIQLNNQQPQSSKDTNCFRNFPNKLYQLLSPSKSTIFCMVVIMITLLLFIFVTLLVSYLATLYAVDYTYNNAECTLQSTNSKLLNGDTDWAGLNYIYTNTTKLNVTLFSRTTVSKNAVRGLLLSGTIAVIKPGLGLPNQTQIRNITNQLNGTGSQNPILITNSAKTYLDYGLRQWLFRNTSLNNVTKFPICQRSAVPIPHPVNDNQTVLLDYMTKICSQVTTQVNNLVANGEAIDKLLSALIATENDIKAIGSNLTQYSQSYLATSSQANSYATSYSSMGVDTASVKSFPLGNLIGFIFYFILVMVYFIVLCMTGCSGLPSIISRFLLICTIGMGVSVCVSSYTLAKSSKYSSQQCDRFKQLLTSKTAFDASSLANQPLMKPLQLCTSGMNTYFNVTTPAANAIHRARMSQLYNLWNLYNQSIPPSFFNSVSNTQIEILKEYLFNIGLIPIKSSSNSTNFIVPSITQAIIDLQSYSNGDNGSSLQAKNCPNVITRDHYVYNAYDCQYQLLNGSNTSQWSTSQPRCVQIPSYNGTSGSNTTLLNQAQNTYTITPTCSQISSLFNISVNGCMMNVRKNLFNVSSNCSAVGNEYGRRALNLVRFSLQASTLTDLYMQNLRNYFGTYVTLSSNITQFFNTKNMTKIMGEFGTLSNNLLAGTSCQYVKSSFDNVYNSYCPDANPISLVLNDGSIWSLISIVVFPLLVVSIFMTDFTIRNYALEIQPYNRINIPPQISKKQFQVSQQTINNEQHNQRQLSDIQNQQNPNHINSNQIVNNIFHRQQKINSQKSSKSSHYSNAETIINRNKTDNLRKIDYSTKKKNYQTLKFKKQIKDNSQDSAIKLNDYQGKSGLEIRRKLPPMFFGFNDSQESSVINNPSVILNKDLGKQIKVSKQINQQQFNDESVNQARKKSQKKNNDGTSSNMKIIDLEKGDGNIDTINL